MGLIFLIIFALAEIALVVLTFTRFGEKAAWLKNRACREISAVTKAKEA